MTKPVAEQTVGLLRWQLHDAETRILIAIKELCRKLCWTYNYTAPLARDLSQSRELTLRQVLAPVLDGGIKLTLDTNEKARFSIYAAHGVTSVNDDEVTTIIAREMENVMREDPIAHSRLRQRLLQQIEQPS